MYYKRVIEETFLKYSKEYKVMLLTGPRQVGKSTMLEHLIKLEGKNREIISFDSIKTMNLAKNDPESFLSQYDGPILIDEAQYVPEIFRGIKIYADKRKTKGDFWLTGSQIFKLMDGVEESLAGRVCNLRLSTMSFAEIYKFDSNEFIPNMKKLIETNKKRNNYNTKNLYKEMYNGSMPTIVAKEKNDKRKYYDDYVSTYLEKDIKYISSKIDTLKFSNFIKILAIHTGQILNINNLSFETGINSRTISNYLDILIKLGIIFLLHPYSNNIFKRSITRPKIYFYDLGLVTYLCGYENAESIEKSNQLGALFENYVISEIYKSYINNGNEPKLYYYRDFDNKEIDLIIEKDNVLYPIEIKHTTNPSIKAMANFQVLQKSKLKIGASSIICTSNEISSLKEGNIVCPYFLI